MKKIFLVCSFFLSSFLLANPVETSHAKASLITNLQSSTQESFYIGVRLQMQEGWHTYWENPGDSGSPFEAKWSADAGVIVENVQWPTPKTIPYPPLMTYGYEDDVIFPFQVFRSLDSKLTKISLDFDFLICADICIPEKVSLSIDLLSASPSSLLDEAINNLPTKILLTKSNVVGNNLKVTFQAPQDFSKAYLFPREDNLFVYTPKQTISQLNDNTYEMTLPLIKDEIESFSGIISLDGQGFQFEEQIFTAGGMSLWQAILFALIGDIPPAVNI